MPAVFKFVTVVALCYLGLVVYVYFSQHHMLYFPAQRLGGTPADVGLPYETVQMVNRLGTKLHGWFVPGDPKRPTLLFCHGNGGNISHRLESLLMFHAMGLNVFIFDYSGYGQSEGVPSEIATQADVRAAWDWLLRDKGVAPSSVVLFGRSLGGAVAAGLAGELNAEGVAPGGMILESTFTSVPDVGASIYPWLPVRLIARFRYDSVEALAKVRIPLLSVHSPDDNIIPYAFGLRLFEAYKGPKEFLRISGDHNRGFLLSGQMYTDGIERFVQRIFGGW
ncbi:alpha/beta hydrolase [Desulfovibrio mangrovi]|uniref:alpha/beta hydrolase n=1 Tax=Desulfovibrio mangrovi TaxID=2976983 RepID=UPI002247C1DD|nr:alpha/beta hydrolase [Desulfovibrio mangrovi]UZP68668.1 alpha/beta hydrolase [Desulfovibrio mangrovi]